MANLKEVRDRISSVKSTQQITKAMKMVAAAKLRRAQTAIVELRPYSLKLNEILSNILANLDSSESSVSLAAVRPVQSALVVLETSNRGLCGGFNSNLIKKAVSLIEGKYAEQYEAGKLSLLVVGKKGFDYFKKRYPKLNLLKEYFDKIDQASFEMSAEISELLVKGFEEGLYDAVDIVYARFVNAAVQDFEVEAFLPVPPPEKGNAEDSDLRSDFIFEPGQKALLEELIPNILKTQLHKTILDNNASEHGARMTAMDNATENADELLRDLRISYNKARQEAITNEISEIVGGAAALEDG